MFNYEAEQYFIGCILYEPELINETEIKPEQLSDKHQTILAVMLSVAEKGRKVDMVSITTELTDAQRERIGGISYLTDLGGAIPTTANFKQYENYIIESYQVKMAREYADQFIRDTAGNPDPTLIDKMAQEVEQIQETRNVKVKSWRDILYDIVDESFEERKGMTGIDTGFTDLNRMTDGLQGNNLIVIGARPSMGKTAFALNIGTNATMKTDCRVDIFSLETPAKRLAKRIISANGNINADMMKRMEFDESTSKNLMQTVGLVDSFDINIHDDSTTTVERIRAIARDGNRQAKKEGKKHLIIIDYLQLITYQGPLQNSVQQIGHISRSLKNMSGDLDVPVIALSQLSRGLESRQDKRPMLSDLRESGAIEQDADIVGFLYRDDYYDSESEKVGITEVIIAKNRDGAIGTVELAFVKEYNKFVNLDRRFDGVS